MMPSNIRIYDYIFVTSNTSASAYSQYNSLVSHNDSNFKDANCQALERYLDLHYNVRWEKEKDRKTLNLQCKYKQEHKIGTRKLFQEVNERFQYIFLLWFFCCWFFSYETSSYRTLLFPWQSLVNIRHFCFCIYSDITKHLYVWIDYWNITPMIVNEHKHELPITCLVIFLQGCRL